ncbi:hypothetical protein [Mameliella alba]|uniref:Uncharacterized protein n=1 Tax=Mameliella alba TaxID=561184 RepID=A0A0B3RR80_9RHOB|nr:hypothetical protein [Mameliella alba]KHQ53620.1 hypothetical protein OA50_01608 [Mameliella alba]
MRKPVLGATALAIWAAGLAIAGPVTEFETEFRAVYADYRKALFMTNSGNRDGSAASLGAFGTGWAALTADHATNPPPQYADDPQWADMLRQVDALLASAGSQVAEGDLAEAHETLEGVREVFSRLHLRNGIQTFSDRMNAYHARMEHVLAIDPDSLTEADLPRMAGEAAVLSYLAGEVAGHPPAEAVENEEFSKLVSGYRASVQTLEDAAQAGDLEALRKALTGLKKPYSMLFLKFG